MALKSCWRVYMQISCVMAILFVLAAEEPEPGKSEAAGHSGEQDLCELQSASLLQLGMELGRGTAVSHHKEVAHAAPAKSGNTATITAIGSSSAAAYELPPLGYAYDALEPSIDKETMTIHHDKHHNTYVVNINKALEGNDQPPLVELQKTAIQRGPAFRNSGGGVYNHDLFWLEMAPVGKGGSPSAKLAAAIDESFGSIDDFKAKFEAAGAPGARFGSGWVWLVVDADKKLAITSTPNQDNPLMEGVEGVPGIPILGCDVWEHAYYLKYQWQRPAYIKAWWDVVNWNQVSAWYEDALAGKAPEVDGAPAAAALVGQRKSDPVQGASQKKGSSFDVKFNWEGKLAFGGS